MKLFLKYIIFIMLILTVVKMANVSDSDREKYKNYTTK